MPKYNPNYTIVVSGLDDTLGAGGAFAINGRSAHLIDDIPTAGLAFDARTGGWIRAVHPVFSPAVDGAVMTYDRHANVELHHLAIARDLHDVQIIDGEVLIVASHENSVCTFPRIGRPAKRWQLPGEPDSWHLNCLADRGDEIFASAFCDGRSYRGWLGCHEGSGLVFSLATGKVVAKSLDMPHSPLFVDGMLLVCNSGAAELVAIDPSEPARRLQNVELGGFTRGLAVFGDNIFVGSALDEKLPIQPIPSPT